jgi:hypothetical protein
MKRGLLLVLGIFLISFISAGEWYNPALIGENGLWNNLVSYGNGYISYETGDCMFTPTGNEFIATESIGFFDISCCANGIGQQIDCNNPTLALGPYFRGDGPWCVEQNQEVCGPWCGNGACQIGEDESNCPADCFVGVVPEFGLIAGITTLLGALGIFFFLRRK